MRGMSPNWFPATKWTLVFFLCGAKEGEYIIAGFGRGKRATVEYQLIMHLPRPGRSSINLHDMTFIGVVGARVYGRRYWHAKAGGETDF